MFSILFLIYVILAFSFHIFFHSHSNDNINMKEREMKSLKRQLDGTSEDLNETSRGKEVALRENRRLQDDLAVMTRENQVRNETPQEKTYLKAFRHPSCFFFDAVSTIKVKNKNDFFLSVRGYGKL